MNSNTHEEIFRNKILWYNFILCTLVVYIHAQNMYVFTEPVTWINQSILFLVDKITSWAVPGFLMCSAYLFYRNLTWSKIPEKLKRRFFSLVIPFLTWNLLYYLLHFVSRQIPYFRQLFDVAVPLSLKELIDAVLFYKYNPVFWFMFYLIVFSFLSPLLYGILKQKWVGLFVVVLIFILNFSAAAVSYLSPRVLGIFEWSPYYLLGSYIGIHWKESVMPKRKTLFTAIFLTSLSITFVLSFVFNKNGWIYIYKACGAAFLWYYIWMADLPEVKSWMKNTFFIYAVHQIMALFINKIANIFLGNSMYVGGLVYLTIPVIVIIFSYYAEIFLSKHFPAIWKVLSGGR